MPSAARIPMCTASSNKPSASDSYEPTRQPVTSFHSFSLCSASRTARSTCPFVTIPLKPELNALPPACPLQRSPPSFQVHRTFVFVARRAGSNNVIFTMGRRVLTAVAPGERPAYITEPYKWLNVVALPRPAQWCAAVRAPPAIFGVQLLTAYEHITQRRCTN